MLRRIAGAVGWAASNRDERNDGQLRSQSGGPGVGGGMLDTVPEVDEETESTEWQAEVGADGETLYPKDGVSLVRGATTGCSSGRITAAPSCTNSGLGLRKNASGSPLTLPTGTTPRN